MPGGEVRLPAGFVAEASAVMHALGDEINDSNAVRNERRRLEQSSARNAAPHTRAGTLAAAEPNTSFPALTARARAVGGGLAQRVAAQRASTSRANAPPPAATTTTTTTTATRTTHVSTDLCDHQTLRLAPPNVPTTTNQRLMRPMHQPWCHRPLC